MNYIIHYFFFKSLIFYLISNYQKPKKLLLPTEEVPTQNNIQNLQQKVSKIK